MNTYKQGMTDKVDRTSYNKGKQCFPLFVDNGVSLNLLRNLKKFQSMWNDKVYAKVQIFVNKTWQNSDYMFLISVAKIGEHVAL